MDNSSNDSNHSRLSTDNNNNSLLNDSTSRTHFFDDLTNNNSNCDSQQPNQPSTNTNNPLSLISKCSQRAFKSDPDSPWTCPSTNSPQQSTRHSHSNQQCLRKRDSDKSDLNNEETNGSSNYDYDSDSMLLDIPPEYARDDIELVVDLYIWFEKVRSFLLGLLC